MRSSPSRYVSTSNSTRVMREDEAAAPRGRAAVFIPGPPPHLGQAGSAQTRGPVVFPHCTQEEIRSGLSRGRSDRMVVATFRIGLTVTGGVQRMRRLE
jgi:hypothetical protein